MKKPKMITNGSKIGSATPTSRTKRRRQIRPLKVAQKAVGGINWLATRTRPDIAFQTGHAMTK
eukprot:12880756-Prorocentrum_lima.AAC.1